MKRIYKYAIQGKTMEAFYGTRELELPEGARVLCVDTQDGDLCLWAEVDPEAPTRKAVLFVVGTGQEPPDQGIYRGTAQQGPYVWHIYEAN